MQEVHSSSTVPWPSPGSKGVIKVLVPVSINNVDVSYHVQDKRSILFGIIRHLRHLRHTSRYPCANHLSWHSWHVASVQSSIGSAPIFFQRQSFSSHRHSTSKVSCCPTLLTRIAGSELLIAPALPRVPLQEVTSLSFAWRGPIPIYLP